GKMTMPPCGSCSAAASYLANESGSTVRIEPGRWMLAAELDLVCTKSPGKIADVRKTGEPLTQVAPRAYSMAASGSPPKRGVGSIPEAARAQHNTLRNHTGIPASL